MNEEITRDRGWSNDGEEDEGEDGMRRRRKEKRERRRELPRSPIMWLTCLPRQHSSSRIKSTIVLLENEFVYIQTLDPSQHNPLIQVRRQRVDIKSQQVSAHRSPLSLLPDRYRSSCRTFAAFNPHEGAGHVPPSIDWTLPETTVSALTQEGLRESKLLTY